MRHLGIATVADKCVNRSASAASRRARNAAQRGNTEQVFVQMLQLIIVKLDRVQHIMFQASVLCVMYRIRYCVAVCSMYRTFQASVYHATVQIRVCHIRRPMLDP